jgi:DNA-binding NtrC family response regulator
MRRHLTLVLDGDPERRQSLVSLLRGLHPEVQAVTDSETAAKAIEAGEVDTLVLDMGLPSIDHIRLRQAIAPENADPPVSLEEAERAHLAQALRYTDGNKRKAAHLLGISRSTLLNKVRKYGLDS